MYESFWTVSNGLYIIATIAKEVWTWKNDRTWTGDTISSSPAMRQMFRLGGTPAWLPYTDRLGLRPLPGDSWDWSNEIEWKIWNGAQQRPVSHWGVAIRVPKTGPFEQVVVLEQEAKSANADRWIN